MFSRIGLFLITNIAVLAVLSISMRVLGIDQMLAAEGIGINLTGLLIMASIIGFAGSFISRVIGTFVDRVVFKNERGFGIGYFIVSIISELILGVFAAMIAAWFSRKREFRADEGGARLAGKHKMIAALQKLQQAQQEASSMPDELAAFGISGGLKHGIAVALMPHPPLEKRIAALRNSE